MNKGIIAFVVILVVLVIIGFVYTNGFKVFGKSTPGNVITVASTTVKPSGNTTTAPTTINYSQSASPCSNFQLLAQQYNTTYTARCISNGSTYGVFLAAGNSGTSKINIVGADKKIYVNNTASYNCTTFLQNFTGPAQIYTITFNTGKGGGSCGNPEVIINRTTTPPKIIYNYIINGNLATGTYTGWNATGEGFGSAPLNLTSANNNMCYYGQP